MKKRPYSLEKLQKTIGANVRTRRKNTEQTQEEFAKAAKIDVRTLGSIERGEANPTLEVLFNIGDALEAHPAQLMTDEVQPKGATRRKTND